MKIVEKILDILVPENKKISKIISLPANIARTLIPESNLQHDHILALFDYQNKITKLLVKSLKYKNNIGVKRFLANLMAEELTTILSDLVLFGGKEVLITPIPMSKKEKTKRGFNQSEELLKEIEKISKLQAIFSYNCLTKIRETKRQADLHKEERLVNLTGSMKANNLCKNKTVIILDDVHTTGSTFSEARRALLASGATKVFGLFIAH